MDLIRVQLIKSHKLKVAVLSWHIHFYFPSDEGFFLNAVFDEVFDRYQFQIEALRHFNEVGKPGHRAILVHDFNQNPTRLETGKAGKVGRRDSSPGPGITRVDDRPNRANGGLGCDPTGYGLHRKRRSIMGIIVWLIVGFIAGLIARFLVPGADPIGWLGTLLLGLVGSTLLNLFNPRLRISVNSRTVYLGGTLDATWSWKGSSARIRRLKIVIEGREERTTGSGKNRSTTTKVFETVPVVDTIDSYQISQGSATRNTACDRCV